MPTFANASAELLFMLESVLQGVRSPEQAVQATQAKIDSIVNAYQGMADQRR